MCRERVLRKLKSMRDLIFQSGFPTARNYGAVRIPSHLEYQNIYDFTPDGVFDEGDFIRLGNEEYQAIWTPGHSHDQYCFYQPERKIMLTGDHILQHISPVIGLWSAYEVDALSLYLRSLDKKEKYEVDRAFSGHGDEIKLFQGRIKDIRSRHQHRLQQVLTSIEGQRSLPMKYVWKYTGRNTISANLWPY